MNVTRIVFLSALYDLFVTAPFATPWTARHALELLARLHEGLGLSGTLPSFADPLTILFANLMGSLVIVWAVVRMISPTAHLGVADTAGRAFFSAWMAFAILQGASKILIGFLVLEISWGLIQGAAALPRVAMRATTAG